MNDFLNKFSKDNYNGKEEIKQEVKEENIPIKAEKRAIESVEHETQIDSSYKKVKIIRYLIIACTIIILAIILVFVIKKMNEVTVKDLVNGEISDAKSWALKNDIELDIKEIYNLKYNEGLVFSQDIKAGTKIQKGSIIYVKVSNGADPDESITIPDFSAMNTTEINEWIRINKVSAYIETEYNNQIENGKFIRKEFSSELVNETNYTRKDIMTIYMSKGSESLNKNITVPSFKDKPKAEVETWAKTNGITIKYKEVGSETVATGSVATQSIAEGTKISKSDTITIEISIGKTITIPNFSNVLKEDAAELYSNLQITIKTVYNIDIPYGKLISQSKHAGKKVYGNDNGIELIYSLGRPYLDELSGKKEKDLPEYFYQYQKLGANITYSTEYVDSDLEKGTVVSASKSNEYLSLSEKITVYVSNGKNYTP